MNRAIHDDNVDLVMSHKWLMNDKIYGETEPFMIAIQDKVIPTNNYKKVIMKDQTIVDDKCRKC